MKKFGLLFILIVSGIIIFFKFGQIPANLALDEVEFTKLALSLSGKPYTAYSTYATGHTTLYFYILLLFFKIFGVSTIVLRLPSAIFGIIGVIIFWFISEEIFNNKLVVFISTLILATSRWYFSFSRFGFEATLLFLLESASLLFLIKFIKKKGERYAYLSSFLTGLAFNSYAAGRIFFVFTLPVIALVVIQAKKNIKEKIKILSISLIIFIITLIPLAHNFITQSTTDTRATQEIFVLNKKLKTSKKLVFLTQNIWNSVSMLFYKGDVNGRHNYPYKPAINIILQILLLFGLSVSILDIKKDNQNKTKMLLFYFWIITLSPMLLTYPWENPNMLRSYPTLIPIIYFIVYGVNKVIKKRRSLSKYVLVLILISSLYEVRTYFKYQTKVYEHSFTINTTLKHLWKSKDIYLDHKEIIKKY